MFYNEFGFKIQFKGAMAMSWEIDFSQKANLNTEWVETHYIKTPDRYTEMCVIKYLPTSLSENEGYLYRMTFKGVELFHTVMQYYLPHKVKRHSIWRDTLLAPDFESVYQVTEEIKNLLEKFKNEI